MGFSLTGTHVIFFVAAVIVAGAVSGVLTAVTFNISSSLSEKCDRVQEQLDTDFKVINDPDNIPVSNGFYLFYLKNIGGGRLVTTNDTFTVFVDGEIVVKGSVGANCGAYMAGGKIVIEGDADDWLGAEMKDGEIVVK
ncbi:MAG TPA: hypothetical protein ENL13_01545, partial [Thermoplasmatales archaeon]|nr:hypothetical protein [Thermoplasmatales archaeon]